METFIALHPSYTLTTTLPFNISDTLGMIAEGSNETSKPAKFNNRLEWLATKRVNESATEPKLTTQSP